MLDSNSVIIKFLRKLKYNPSTDYYKYINLWKEWYENEVPKFHEYHDSFGEKRTLYKLGMAKRVCEDWSSILYTERDSVVCQNENNNSYLEKELDKLKFNDIVPQNIETAFWSGTVGTILRVKNAKVINKEIVADKDTYYDLVSVNASQIIPLVVEDGKIQDVAFVSETIIENEKAYYIEIHELTKNGYVVKNKYINEKGEEKKNPSVAEEYETHSKIPLFSLLSPRIVNNIEDNNGLGISVYANAIDQLKICDMACNNLAMDYFLGGKKIFYNKKLVRYENITYTDASGQEVTREVVIYPDDITKQQWQIVGDPDSHPNDEPLITEYNPDLRIEENENGSNFALNMLAFKCGMGKNYYKLDSNGSVATATQVLLDNKDLVGNAKKHRSAVNDYTVGLIRAILLLGKLVFKQSNLDENDEIMLVDKDGFMVSEEDLKQQYMEEIAAGLRSKTSYMVKFYGMSEEEARRELNLIDEEDRAGQLNVDDDTEEDIPIEM